MQRSMTTSTPRSGFVSVGSTSSRSSITFVGTPREDSSCRSSFSSTRTRESRTPTVGWLFTPVFFGLGRERQRDRRDGRHLELRAAIRARDDLALHGVGADGHVGIALGTLGHDSSSPQVSRRGVRLSISSEKESVTAEGPRERLVPFGGEVASDAATRLVF